MISSVCLSIVSLIPIYSMSHDVIEIIGSNKSIIIKISLNKHFLNFLISHIFTQILRNFLKLKRGNFPLQQTNKLQPYQYQKKQIPFLSKLYYPYHSFQPWLILRTKQNQFLLIDLSRVLLKFDRQIYFGHQILNLRRLILIIVDRLYHLNHCRICRKLFLCLLLIIQELLKWRNLKHEIRSFKGFLAVILVLLLKDLMGLLAFLAFLITINNQLKTNQDEQKNDINNIIIRFQRFKFNLKSNCNNIVNCNNKLNYILQ